MREHQCLDNDFSTNFSWWEYDAQGIPLCRVCDTCRSEKLSRYRPEILSGYDQSDVDEPIEGELPIEGDFDEPIEEYLLRISH
jgi:hypothetical protein